MNLKRLLTASLMLGLLMPTACQRYPKDVLARRLSDTSFQEDKWKFEYTTTELPGNTISDGYSGTLTASGQWSIFNFKATNSTKKKLDVWDLDLESWILITSDGQRWEYESREIYPDGLNTVSPNQSYNLKIAFDIPLSTRPKTLIYEFYDNDFNRKTFEINVDPK